MFSGTPLLEEAQRGEFDPLTEKEMLEEMKLFAENLTCDCAFITHHTIFRRQSVRTGFSFTEGQDHLSTGTPDQQCRYGPAGSAPPQQTDTVK